jgi:hypothetical protein
VNSAGVIDAYTGTGGLPHPTGVDMDHFQQGAITIRLANAGASCKAGDQTDFLDSPNGGGVYKVWVTPVSQFLGSPTLVDNACGGGCSHGFINSQSKTDNFKINFNQTTVTFCLTLIKQLDDGTGTNTFLPAPGWGMHITDSLGTTKDVSTGGDGSVQACNLVPGTYTVTEDTIIGSNTYKAVGLTVNGTVLSPQPVYSFFWNIGSPNPFVILFQNQLTSTGPPV